MINKEEVLEKILIHRNPHFHSQFPIILHWSHKSGCTSLVNWFFFQTGLLEKALQYNSWVHQYEIEVYKKKSIYQQELRKHMLQSKKDMYKLVRNPYSRAVSSFLMLSETHNPFWSRIWENIREYLYNDRKCTKGLSFKEFLVFIKNKGSDVASIDGHFAQQYIAGEEVFVNNYIYLENFIEQISQIEKKYGLTRSNIQKISQSPHHYASSMIYKGDYSEVDILDPFFPRFPTYDSFYNEETKKLVNEIYKKDFEIYGY